MGMNPGELEPLDDSWADMVDSKLASLNMRVTVSLGLGGIGALAGGLSIVTIGKISKVLAQIQQVLNGATGTVQQVRQEPVRGVNTPPDIQDDRYTARSPNDIGKTNRNFDEPVIDETRDAVAGQNIAKPFEGPSSNLSEETRAAIEYDPLNPGRISREGFIG